MKSDIYDKRCTDMEKKKREVPSISFTGVLLPYFQPIVLAAFSHSISYICYAMHKLYRFSLDNRIQTFTAICTAEMQPKLSSLPVSRGLVHHSHPSWNLLQTSFPRPMPLTISPDLYVTYWPALFCRIKYKVLVLTSKACIICYGSLITSYVLSNCWWL